MLSRTNTPKLWKIFFQALALVAASTGACAQAEEFRCEEVPAATIDSTVLRGQLAECRDKFFHNLRVPRGGATIDSASIQPEAFCRRNHAGAGHNRAAYSNGNLPRLEIAGFNEPVFNATGSHGACEFSWQGTQAAACAVKQRRHRACNEVFEKLARFSNCISDGEPAKCQGEHVEVANLYQSTSRETDEAVKRASSYLQRLAQKNQDVIAKFQADRAALASLPRGAAQESHPTFGQVQAQYGGVTRIIDYKNLLGRASGVSELEQEQKQAKEAALKLARQLEEAGAQQRQWAQKVAEVFAKYRKPPDATSLGGGNVTSGIGAAAPLASSLSQAGGGASAVSAAGSLLPAVAAAGAGAAALGSTSFGSPGASASSAAGGASATAPAVAAPVAGATLGGEPSGPASIAPATVARAPEESSPASPPPAIGAALPVASAAAAKPTTGASRAGEAKAARATEVAGARAPASAPSGPSDDLLKAFGGDLSPPTGRKNDAPDMNNLMGQMKSLFNFDQNLGFGSGPGAGPGGPLEGSGFQGEDNGSMGGQYAGGYDDSGEYTPGEGGFESAQGSPFGAIGTNLFDRVHRRHRKCIERGLVIFNQEVPQ